MDNFEEIIRELTRPLNGQYPRPWMTDLKDPQSARVFIVGKNQHTEYPEVKLTHERHLDALFNRNGESCRGMYDFITGQNSSAARENIAQFSDLLKQLGVSSTLETNVICYATPTSRDVRLPQHRGGRERGEMIFRYLLKTIKPAVLVVHGASAAQELGRMLGVRLPEPPRSEGELCVMRVGQSVVYVIRSLGRPEYNKWQSWAPGYLAKVASAVARELRAS